MQDDWTPSCQPSDAMYTLLRDATVQPYLTREQLKEWYNNIGWGMREHGEMAPRLGYLEWKDVPNSPF
eukprot:5011882-Prorocentrum_lima.AAC.1